ncbi:hypothetical protein MK280_16795, partial [Myxococcota bacterium]|nr:hypothetical protein [Myxococcota bacterium]
MSQAPLAPMDPQQIENLFDQRVLVIDGAMGTMVQSYGLEESDFRGSRFAEAEQDLAGDNELLSLTR